MLSLKGDLHKETKGTPKSFERSLDEDNAILKNYEFEEYWELSNAFARSLSYSNRSMKTKVQQFINSWPFRGSLAISEPCKGLLHGTHRLSHGQHVVIQL